MVTISRAEYEQLQQEKAQMESTRVRLEAERIKLEAEHARLEAKLAALEQEQAQVITSLTLQNEWLLEQLKLSKKKLFGRSSEQAEQLVMDQLGLIMNEAEAYIFGMNSAGKAPVTVKAYERKRQSGNVLDVVPEGTPAEVVEHRLPENERICSACGSEMVEIGKEVRRSLMMEPAEFWVREDVYYTYACKNCEQETGEANIVKAAKKAFDELGVKRLPSVKSLQEEYAKLLSEKKAAYAEYRRSRDEMRELLLHKQNVDRMLGKNERSEEKKQEHDRQ
jgi:transposase